MDYLNYYKNKKVVIPGGNGFLGSHLVESLKQIPCRVFIPKRKDGIDFRKYEDCLSYIEKVKPHIIINCAANQGGIAYFVSKESDIFMDNMLMGTFLMKGSQKAGVDKFINIVAACSYPGYLKKEEMSEEDYWDGKIHESIFSLGFPRKASVQYGLALKKQYGFNSIHLILANMYGPGEHFNPDQSKALAALIRKIYEAREKKLPNVEIWGTGKPIRDWLYVKDAAEGILRAGALYNDIEPMNISTGVGISITKLAETIKAVIGYEGKFVYDMTKPDGALNKIFEISKVKKELNWAPKTSITQGVKETVEWFSKNYKTAIKY